MTKEEIKKALYKEKPEATFNHCKKDMRGIHLLYSCELGGKGPEFLQYFRVPIEDIEDAVFPNTMGAQLLIRYIIQPESAENGV